MEEKAFRSIHRATLKRNESLGVRDFSETFKHENLKSIAERGFDLEPWPEDLSSNSLLGQENDTPKTAEPKSFEKANTSKEIETRSIERVDSGQKKFKLNKVVPVGKSKAFSTIDELSGKDEISYWDKLRVATKTVGILNAVKDDVLLFGRGIEEKNSDAEFLDEYINNHKRWWILLPHYKIRKTWEALVITLLFYVIVFVPVRVCFDVEVTGFAYAFDIFVDALFIFDLFIQCICAYVNEEGTVIVDQRAILSNYARGWLFFDIIASVPLYIIFEEILDGNQVNRLGKLARLPKIFRLAKLLRLVKLLRVIRLVRYVQVWEKHLGMNVALTRLIKTIFGLTLVTHLIACLWYLTSWILGDNPESWIYRHGIQDNDLMSSYLASIYWAISTLTTVGFGDISAYTDIERTFAIVCMVAGVSWYAFVISTISSIMQMFDRRNTNVKKNLSLIIQFMQSCNMPWGLRKRILRYVEYVSKIEAQNSEKDVQEVLGLLSPNLQTEVLLHVHRETIKEVAFFKNKTQDFVAKCVSKFKPLKVAEDEAILLRGQIAREIFFLTSGKTVISYGESSRLISMSEGAYFGEIGCLLEGISQISVTAITEATLYTLQKSDFQELLTDFPDVGKEIRKVASLRLARYQEMSRQEFGETFNSFPRRLTSASSTVEPSTPKALTEYIEATNQRLDSMEKIMQKILEKLDG